MTSDEKTESSAPNINYGPSILSQKWKTYIFIITMDLWRLLKFLECPVLLFSGFVLVEKFLKFSTVRNIYPIAVNLGYICPSFYSLHTLKHAIQTPKYSFCVFLRHVFCTRNLISESLLVDCKMIFWGEENDQKLFYFWRNTSFQAGT